MKVFAKFLIVLLIAFSSNNLLAFAPEDHLPEPQEQRAHNLFLQIKCPVCLGQVIESSDSEVAYQLRQLVRQEITAGKSDEEIKIDLVNKYGDDILNAPPLNSVTFLLWFLPIIFLLGGFFVIRKLLKKS